MATKAIKTETANATELKALAAEAFTHPVIAVFYGRGRKVKRYGWILRIEGPSGDPLDVGLGKSTKAAAEYLNAVKARNASNRAAGIDTRPAR